MKSATITSANSEPSTTDLAAAILDISTQLPGGDVAWALDLFLVSALSFYAHETLGSQVNGKYGVNMDFFLRPQPFPERAPVEPLVKAVACYDSLVDSNAWSDVLGSAISALGTAIPNHTRLVTPAGPARLAAAMAASDGKRFLTESTFSMFDPFCGSGGNVLAFVDELIKRHGDKATRSRLALTVVESNTVCATISALQLLANQLKHGPLQSVNVSMGDWQNAAARNLVFGSSIS